MRMPIALRTASRSTGPRLRVRIQHMSSCRGKNLTLAKKTASVLCFPLNRGGPSPSTRGSQKILHLVMRAQEQLVKLINMNDEKLNLTWNRNQIERPCGPGPKASAHSNVKAGLVRRVRAFFSDRSARRQTMRAAEIIIRQQTRAEIGNRLAQRRSAVQSPASTHLRAGWRTRALPFAGVCGRRILQLLDDVIQPGSSGWGPGCLRLFSSSTRLVE